MPRKYDMYIGDVPADENCVQVSSAGVPYLHEMKRERSIYREQLRREFGPEPPNSELAIIRESHDFGSYYSLIFRYDDGDEKALEYGLKCESQGSLVWDETARRELGLKPNQKYAP